jgi:ArsR family transcriptional regulator
MPSLDAIVEGLKAAGEPTRLRLLALLSRAELTVTEITQILKQSQPRVSRHLKLLTDAGLIDRYREGSWVFYRTAEGTGKATFTRMVLGAIEPNDPAVVRDLDRLDDVRAQRTEQAQAYFAANAAKWDEVRKLHVADGQVESAMMALLRQGKFKTHLDAGTGTGRIVELIAPLCERSTGVDLNPEMLAVARARLPKAHHARAHFRLADLHELPYPDRSFDLVTIHQVLHYLDEPAHAVKEAARVLSPQGSLMIVDFAPHNLEPLREAHRHRRLGFSQREVQSWLDQAGLSLVEGKDLAPSSAGGLTVSLWLASAGAKTGRPKAIEAHV